jgi:isochorismate pyruvate lyase
MKEPKDCSSIEEIREAIDVIDLQIINLFGKRFEYVKEIVKYKTDKDSIKAKERYDFVLEQRAHWAVKHGLDPNVIEHIYKYLMDHFIQEELKILAKKNQQ